MTDDRHDPKSGAPRKRPGPTIDLTATDVTPEQKTSASSQASPDKETKAPGGAPPQGPGHSMRDISDRFLSGLPWPAVAAAGGGAVAIFLLGLWAGGVVSDNTANEKLVRLETQLSEAANRPVVIDARSLEELSLRLAKIETAARTADPGLSSRIAALEASIKAAAENAASRERRADEIATIAREARGRADAAAASADNAQKARAGASDVVRTDIEALIERIAALEQAMRSNESEMAKRPADDPKGRLAIAAAALRDAVERGGAFTAELAAAKSLAPDAKALAPLEGFAAGGLPSMAVLSRELSALVPPLTRSAGRGPREGGGFLEKLQANAEKLVRIRPVGEVAGDEPDHIIARIEAKATSGDIAGALDELAKLPAPMRAPAEPWIKKAAARNAAVGAARQFAQGALAAIGKSGS